MPSLQAAVERLTENSALTGDLSDDQARALLAWGKQQVAVIHARALPEADFEAQFAALSALLLHINSVIGFREYATPEQQQTALTRIRDAAAALGLHTAWLDQPDDAIHAHADEDKLSAIRSMTAQLTGTSVADEHPLAQIAAAVNTAASALASARAGADAADADEPTE